VKKTYDTYNDPAPGFAFHFTPAASVSACMAVASESAQHYLFVAVFRSVPLKFQSHPKCLPAFFAAFAFAIVLINELESAQSGPWSLMSVEVEI